MLLQYLNIALAAFFLLLVSRFVTVSTYGTISRVSVAGPDPGSRMNIPDHISEGFETIFWV